MKDHRIEPRRRQELKEKRKENELQRQKEREEEGRRVEPQRHEEHEEVKEKDKRIEPASRKGHEEGWEGQEERRRSASRKRHEHEGENRRIEAGRFEGVLSEEIERVARVIVDSAIRVHRELGPGLLESAYQRCMEFELKALGLDVQCEVPLPIRYRKVEIEVGYRLDMLIGGCVIVENKAVTELRPIHTAQILTYLKLSGHRLGFLLNWNVPLMKQGIKRFVL